MTTINTPAYALSEITKVYLTDWSSSVVYNYSGNTRISEYTNLPGGWYEIVLNTATCDYTQTLTKGSNGLTYTEIITITLPHEDNAKWRELTSVLQNRYIVVFGDANGNWWTIGYRNGVKVDSYELSNNEYIISLTSQFSNNLLTSIDYNYVLSNIV